MSESVILRKILLRASALGMRLFRNQVGSYHLPDGRWITSGLCVGSSDLIGWTPVVVTPDMIGKTLAVFTAVETKSGDNKATSKQEDFIAAVQAAGGFAGVARTVSDLDHVKGAAHVDSTDLARTPRVGSGPKHPLGHITRSSGAS